MSDEPRDAAELASLGGRAAAANMTPAELSERARKAAESRWSANLPFATHDGTLRIVNREIVCAVLQDKRRVLNQETFLSAIGRSRKAKAGTGSARIVQVDELPPFLAADNLKPFIDDELRGSTTPIIYRTTSGGRAYGYEATLLPNVCRVYLNARNAGQLKKNQLHVAEACAILDEALSNVGIIALVDEATGYQYERPRLELAEYLALYINKKLARWASTFPASYYAELYRLRDWTYDEKSTRRTPLLGKMTNDLVYCRLAPFVLRELQKITPRNAKGRLKNKLFQRLTPDPGIRELKEHFKELGAISRGYERGDYDGFYRHVSRSLPKQPQDPDLFSGIPFPEPD